jgi:ornithine cyclodeaminase
MKVVTLDEIRSVLGDIDLLPLIEEGFAQYSAGNAVVPPVGELLLEGGDVHIKYGYIKGQSHYVIKIASGFYDNAKLGLSGSQGMMLLFRQATGQPVCLLLDEGWLTQIRTAVAGAIVAKYLAPSQVHRIGIAGTGTQARLQLEFLAGVTACREVTVWGRGSAQLEAYCKDMRPLGFELTTTQDADDLLRQCNLIVTTTPSTTPLLHADALKAGTHITAMGSDTAEKQELETGLLAQADQIVADSISQCLERGETHHALRSGDIRQDQLMELGQIINGERPGRSSEEEITIADLTGVAVQDIQIASAVWSALQKP